LTKEPCALRKFENTKSKSFQDNDGSSPEHISGPSVNQARSSVLSLSFIDKSPNCNSVTGNKSLSVKNPSSEVSVILLPSQLHFHWLSKQLSVNKHCKHSCWKGASAY